MSACQRCGAAKLTEQPCRVCNWPGEPFDTERILADTPDEDVADYMEEAARQSALFSVFVQGMLDQFVRDRGELQLTEAQVFQICGVKKASKIKDLLPVELLQYCFAMALLNNEKLLEENRLRSEALSNELESRLVLPSHMNRAQRRGNRG